MEVGTYVSLERIIHYEGGMSSTCAIKAGLLYAKKAKAMGGQWLLYNPMAERTDILYVRKSCKTEFQRRWELYTKSTSGEGKEEVLKKEIQKQEVQKEESTTPRTPAPKTKSRSSVHPSPCTEDPPNKRVKKNQQSDPGTEQEQKAKMERNKKANQVKHRYLKMTTLYQQIVNSIATDEAYEWAKGSSIVSKMERTWQSVQATVDQDSFNKFFIMNEMAEVRSQYPEDHDRKIERFIEVGDALQLLEAEIQKMNKMHLASKA